MLIEFRTDAHGNIRMFESTARRLLEAAGMGANTPGAIQADNLPAAIERLQAAMEGSLGDSIDEAGDQADQWDDEAEITLRQRANPLLDLLQAASRAADPVLWRSVE